jgi:predicted TIM-barrel fold metal-dependent hydrolase
MASSSGIPVFDADNHLYESPEAFTRHLPARYRNAVQYVNVNGRTKIAVAGRISEYIPNPTFEVVARPGAQEEYYRVAIHAVNQWLCETWQFDYAGRIFTTPIITLPIVEKAIEELEWVLARGARAVLVRPAPVPGYKGPRSFALPEFDPFWARVVEADILVALHSSDSGYERFANEWIGGNSEFLPFQPSAFRMLSSWRPIEDAVASLIVHGTLTRFPMLKIALVENGASWIEPLQKSLKDLYKKMPQDFPENPIEAMRRCIHISPFWEEDFGHLAELLGPDRVLFGSDYPHPEGLGDPVKFAEEIGHLGNELVGKVMGGNLARLMNEKNAPLAPAH